MQHVYIPFRNKKNDFRKEIRFSGPVAQTSLDFYLCNGFCGRIGDSFVSPKKTDIWKCWRLKNRTGSALIFNFLYTNSKNIGLPTALC